jgi:hypothetical protein
MRKGPGRVYDNFVRLYFFFWPLCCLFFFNIRILIVPLVSSNSSNSYILSEKNTSNFYGLPKVHKREVISNAILEQHTECIKIFNLNDLKFRPIVGGPNCITQRLSHFIDIILKKLQQHYLYLPLLS